MRISDWSSDVCSSDLHTINSATGNRVRSRYIDAETNKPVREEDEVRGYETEEGRHVVIEDEELEAVGLESTRRSEEHTSELQSLMRISYAVFCLKKKKKTITKQQLNILPPATI